MKSGPNTASGITEAAAAWVARRDAGLSADEETELAAWLSTDARHRQAFAEHGLAWSLLDRPGRNGVADDVLEHLHRLDRRQRRRRGLTGAVAAVALLGGLSFWTITR